MRTDLVVVNGNLTAACYMNKIVDLHIIPFLNANGPGFILQQDNVCPHIANVVRTHFQHTNVPWPAVSPDNASNKHVWDELVGVSTNGQLNQELLPNWHKPCKRNGST